MSPRLLVLVPYDACDPQSAEAEGQHVSKRLRAAGFEPVRVVCIGPDVLGSGVPDEPFAGYAEWTEENVDGVAVVGGALGFHEVLAMCAKLNGRPVPCRTPAGWLTWKGQQEYMARLRHPAGKGRVTA